MKKSTSKRKPYHLNGRPRPAVSIAKPQLEQKYDPDSGQIYQEQEVRFFSKRNTDWTRERVGRGVIYKDRLPEKGTRSLADTAVFELARHCEDLTTEHFASVPWPIARRIWDRLVSRYARISNTDRDPILLTLYQGVVTAFTSGEYLQCHTQGQRNLDMPVTGTEWTFYTRSCRMLTISPASRPII